MKRSEAVKKLEFILNAMKNDKDNRIKASQIISYLECDEIGMKPPHVSEEDCQAIMDVYYAGYTFNQWDEDLEKDQKVQESKKRRKNFKMEKIKT